MTRSPKEQCLVLCCSYQGQIQEFIRDDFDLAAKTLGKLFVQMVHAVSITDALNFLAEINKAGRSFGWNLNLMLEERLVGVHFAGLAQPDYVLIVGASTQNAL